MELQITAWMTNSNIKNDKVTLSCYDDKKNVRGQNALVTTFTVTALVRNFFSMIKLC